jgi:hypothetical protein
MKQSICALGVLHLVSLKLQVLARNLQRPQPGTCMNGMVISHWPRIASKSLQFRKG